MEYRQLGRSGLRVSCLSLGTMTFGGRGDFAKVGSTDTAVARRQVDECLDAGINLIDTADIYSHGLSEEIVGAAIDGRRDRVLVATKARMKMGDGANDAGLSRHHLIGACEASLRRLGVDHIDLYQLHEWDGVTPVEETLEALDYLVRSGKVRYVGCSNFAGWQLAKSLGVAERRGLPRYISQQIHYSLQAREAEYELVPAGWIKASESWSGAHSQAVCCRGNIVATRSRPPAHGISPIGASRRSATRSSSTTSSTRWWRLPPSVTCPLRRSRLPGCSAGQASPRS